MRDNLKSEKVLECLVCGTFLQNEKANITDQTIAIRAKLQRFLQAIQRFINSPVSVNDKLAIQEQICSCTGCLSRIESFLEKYHLWKRAELLLQWEIDKLLQILKFAKGNECNQLRSAIITKCEHVRRNALPRVRLSRIQKKTCHSLERFRVNRVPAAVVKKESIFPSPAWLLSLAVVSLLQDQMSLESKMISNDIACRAFSDVAEQNDIEMTDEFEFGDASSVSSASSFSSIEKLEKVVISEAESGNTTEGMRQQVKVEQNPLNSTTERHFSCSVCSKSFYFQTVLQRHMKNQHLKTRVKVKQLWHCVPCKRKFTTYFSYRLHLFRSHQRNRKNLIQKFCAAVIKSPAQVTRYNLRTARKRSFTQTEDDEVHVKTEVDDNSNSVESFEEEKRSKSLRQRRSTKKQACSVCHLKVKRGKWMARHVQTSHNVSDMEVSQVKRCALPNCNAYFRTQQQRYTHLKIVHRYSNTVKTEHKKRFLCPVKKCTSRFSTREQLQNHEKLHGKFKCNSCSKEVSYAPDLPVHEMTHVICNENDTQKPYRCLRCNVCFKRKHVFIEHFCAEHLGLSSKVIRCPVCNMEMKENRRSSREARSLKSHLMAVHGIKSVEDSVPENSVNCDLCPAFFRLALQLHMHKMRDHWKFRCPECPYKPKATLHVSKSRDFKNHLRMNHPHLLSHLSFVCRAKGCINGRRNYADQAALDKHMKQVHPVEGFQCSKCEKNFPSGFVLRTHERNVHTERSFVCAECGKAFKIKNALKTHMEFHKPPEERKFQCDTCQKRFADRQKLTQHQRTHTKEKPFVCQFCGAAYGHRHNWRAHMTKNHPKEFADMNEGQEMKKGKKEGNFMKRKGSKKGEYLTAGVQQQ